jgi:predicted Zn-dependent protease
MKTDEEIAGIIGHEVGHISKRHTVRQIEKGLGMSVLFGVLFGGRGAILQDLAMNAIMAGYSRSDEREADQLGYYYTVKTGYNPYSMLMGLQKLNELPQKSNYGLFSSHPEPEARVNLVKSYISKAKISPAVTVNKNGTAQVTDRGLASALFAAYRGKPTPHPRLFTAGALYLASRTPASAAPASSSTATAPTSPSTTTTGNRHPHPA